MGQWPCPGTERMRGNIYLEPQCEGSPEGTYLKFEFLALELRKNSFVVRAAVIFMTFCYNIPRKLMPH